jgi:hypothetical protein
MMLIFAYAVEIFITDVPYMLFVVTAGAAPRLPKKLFSQSTGYSHATFGQLW